MNELISLIFATHKVIKRQLSSKQHDAQLSMLQIKALHYISEHKNITMRDLAEELNITPASITSLTNSLITSKLIIRRLDTKDRRVIHLSLTPLGRNRLRSGIKAIVEKMNEVFSTLSSTDQRSLIKILKTITQAYE